jgi:peptide/nickel transport system ATP-binding protein
MSPLLSVRDLTVRARVGAEDLTIVDRVSFDLAPGEVLGLVGESGSGKSVTCRALIRLLPGANLRLAGGSILLEGTDLAALDDQAMRDVRGSAVGMVFQNAGSHLDPVMRIGDQIAESLRAHRKIGRREARGLAIETLRQVGIPDPARRADSFPHEFSGGMRQRAMVALALVTEPKMLVADEPTTALDVTVQAQILRLLLDLRDTRGLSIILITHDLGVVAQSCDSIAVMYGGRIVERGPKRRILEHAVHPYTVGLISCQPASEGEGRLAIIPGQPPSIHAMPPGCPFHPRCTNAIAECSVTMPAARSFGPGHSAACHAPVMVSDFAVAAQ